MHGSCRNISPGSHFTAVSKTHFLMKGDTLLALVFYRLLTNKGANCHAKVWYEGNYTYLAFPHANLTSQNISRVLKELGREEIQRRLFEEYMSSIYGDDGAAGILVDSTRVSNATRMDITQISNHNGEISREVRLIYVIDRDNGMPIYFRYVAGNIIMTLRVGVIHILLCVISEQLEFIII